MNIHSLRWIPFRIPFAVDFRTATGDPRHREGVLLWLTTDDGIVGVGEASPWPSFGGGTAADALAVLREQAPTLLGADLPLLPKLIAGLPSDRPGARAARCALDVAAWDALARAQGVPVARLLGGSLTPSVPLNATIGACSADAAAKQARKAVESGFGTVKLKVGLTGSPEAEAERVAAVRDAIGPTVGLRLDANGAWTAEEAIAVIRRLEAYQPQFIEQPVSAGDPVILSRVRHTVHAPLATDEAVTSLDAVKEIIGLAAADVLIVKPMITGGLEPARTIVELGTVAGLRVVVTTTIDTGVGIAAALHLAATLPRPLAACGLATAPLLASDLLIKPLPVHNGEMMLPTEPGLGVVVDETELGRYVTGDVETVGPYQ